MRKLFLILILTVFSSAAALAGDIHDLTTNLINQQRRNNGCSTLRQNQKLQQAAQSHAEWMAKVGKMEHVQQHDNPRSFAHHKVCDWIHINRIIKTGYFNYEDCFYARQLNNGKGGVVAETVQGIDDMSGEIIAAGWGASNMGYSRQLQQHVVPGWMKSPGHRKEILTRNYEEMGVGYAVGPKGSFWCVTFGDPKRTSSMR